MSSTTHGTTPYYFVPGPSRHPAMAALGLFFVILGAGQWVNGADWGKYSLAFGMVFWLVVLYQWFSDAVSESMGGQYGRKIDLSYRWSMTWFIFSEVMFFGAFFTALWWARSHSVPALGSLEILCFGQISRRLGQVLLLERLAPLLASLSPSPPWAHSGCPPSIPLCC